MKSQPKPFSEIDPKFKCPNKFCQKEFSPEIIPSQFVKNLQFKFCQVCGLEFDNYPPGCNYERYVEHLTKECEGLTMSCPLGCGFKGERNKIEDHLEEQECPKQEV